MLRTEHVSKKRAKLKKKLQTCRWKCLLETHRINRAWKMFPWSWWQRWQRKHFPYAWCRWGMSPNWRQYPELLTSHILLSLIDHNSQEKTDQIWITLYVCMCAFFLSNKIIIELNNEKKGKIGDLRSWQRKSNHQFWISLLDDPCSPKHLGWFGPVFEEECSFWMWVVKWKFWYQERDWGSVAQRELKV